MPAIEQWKRCVDQLARRSFRCYTGRRADAREPRIQFRVGKGFHHGRQSPRRRCQRRPAICAAGAHGLPAAEACEWRRPPARRVPCAPPACQRCSGSLSPRFPEPLRGWLTLACASEVSTAIACLRGKARGLDAVTLDEELEPGPQYRFLSWPHRHGHSFLKPRFCRKSVPR